MRSQITSPPGKKPASEGISKGIGNRYPTCRKYYVHPAIIDTYLEGELGEIMEKYDKSKSKDLPQGLRSEERAVVGVLEKSMP
ncbi:MAG: hypothetical protein RIM23_14645 [Coleofasciculus sp. G3-WIS-01]